MRLFPLDKVSDRVGEALQLFANALGLGFVAMLNGIFKQQIKPLDFLNHIVSLWHRHGHSPFNQLAGAVGCGAAFGGS